MKKLLLGSVAVIGLAAVATPASAEGLKLDVGGHFKGYAVWSDQDTNTGTDARSFDMLRDTEIQFSGETTLDNGLTVGVHVEAKADPNNDAGEDFFIDESYAYFSGAWGRVNVGDEDGAAYLLQVAAPSADSNVDGIRQFVNPVNYTVANSFMPTTVGAFWNASGLDYDNDAAGNADKFTYLTPVLNGFQAGVSYTPDTRGTINNDYAPQSGSIQLAGLPNDSVANDYGDAWELAARYEGQMDELGFTIGGGYTKVNLDNDVSAIMDDFTEWNAGLDMNWGAFGLGVVYTENNNGQDVNDSNDTWVVGLDYTTGPFKFGASYLNNQTDAAGPTNEVDTDRWTGGVVYTYGPGMTFRGSLSYVDHSIEGASDVDATSVLVGTQIRF